MCYSIREDQTQWKGKDSDGLSTYGIACGYVRWWSKRLRCAQTGWHRTIAFTSWSIHLSSFHFPNTQHHSHDRTDQRVQDRLSNQFLAFQHHSYVLLHIIHHHNYSLEISSIAQRLTVSILGPLLKLLFYFGNWIHQNSEVVGSWKTKRLTLECNQLNADYCGIFPAGWCADSHDCHILCSWQWLLLG